jgi:hypothetical protein
VNFYYWGLYWNFREVNCGQKGYLKIKYPPYAVFLEIEKGYLKIKYPPYGVK